MSPNENVVDDARSTSPETRNLQPVLAALELRVAALEQAFNTNTQVFSESIQMLELQNEALRRVVQDLLDDVFTGTDTQPERVHCAADGRIAFGTYLQEYVRELMAQERQDQEVAESARRPGSNDEDLIVFGGTP